MRTLKAQWEDYEDKILNPAMASVVQRVESKRAFYAGAAAMFAEMNQASTTLSEPEACNVLSGLFKELLEFQEAVNLGRA
jgi:hypothetical protein